MIRQYHAHLIKRADAAASSGSVFIALAAMQRDAMIWAIPALIALSICWLFQLSGVSSLWVSLPLVGMSIIGGIGYVGTIYCRALTRFSRVR